MTKYENAIYQIINASREHLTVQQVFQKLKARYPHVVAATVYNTLHKLWEAGLIRKVSVAGTPDRYDRVQRHDHLVCKRCGRLTDIFFADLTASLQSQLREEVLFYDLKVYDLCPACRQEEGPGAYPRHSSR